MVTEGGSKEEGREPNKSLDDKNLLLPTFLTPPLFLLFSEAQKIFH